jgi:hypothetical protein
MKILMKYDVINYLIKGHFKWELVGITSSEYNYNLKNRQLSLYLQKWFSWNMCQKFVSSVIGKKGEDRNPSCWATHPLYVKTEEDPASET